MFHYPSCPFRRFLVKISMIGLYFQRKYHESFDIFDIDLFEYRLSMIAGNPAFHNYFHFYSRTAAVMRVWTLNIHKLSGCDYDADDCIGSPSSMQCGFRPSVASNASNRIVNGEDAIPHSWPWQCSISLDVFGIITTHICGCAIVSPNWVVTAAHCK